VDHSWRAEVADGPLLWGGGFTTTGLKRVQANRLAVPPPQEAGGWRPSRPKPHPTTQFPGGRGLFRPCRLRTPLPRCLFHMPSWQPFSERSPVIFAAGGDGLCRYPPLSHIFSPDRRGGDQARGHEGGGRRYVSPFFFLVGVGQRSSWLASSMQPGPFRTKWGGEEA